MTVGLYFGSFNPIHNGHLIIASYVANYTDLQRIWFVISPQNPFKHESSLIAAQQRKHLIDLAIDGEKKLRSSNVEFKLPVPSFTIDTLTYLRDRHPEYQFTLIIGSDSFQNIKKWKNSEILLRDYPIIIYERPGFPVDQKMVNEKIIVLKAPMLDISSTQIRKIIKEKKSIRYLVPDIVMEEIERQQYYS